MTTFAHVQGRCPACSRTSLILGSAGHVTCSHLDCPAPTAADELLHRQTIGRWPGERCEITLDVITAGRKLQSTRITPLPTRDTAITRALVAAELRAMATEIEALQDQPNEHVRDTA